MTGIDVEGGRVTRVRTDRGDVEAEYVVIACGVWSPRIARMAGASIPLTPAVHQMIDVGPVPRFATSKSAIEFPIVRDMDTNMYERQDGSGLEVGSYAHRPILHDPDEIPSIEESALTPTELPFTQDDFVQQMEDALELVPEILGDESRGHQVRDQRAALAHAGRPADPRRDARGARGSGRPPPCGSRRARAWAAPWPSGWSRASPRSTSRPPTSRASTSTRRRASTCRSRAAEGFNKTYGIVHPGEQWESGRAGAAARPSTTREQALGAVFFEAAGWERPHWYESNAPLLEEFADQVDDARGRVGLALVVADHQRRAPGDARPRRDVRPDRVLRLRHRRAGRARVRAEASRCGRWT